MRIYFNGLELLGVGIFAVCLLFSLICILLDKWCNRHWGHPVQKWLYRTLLKK